MLDLNARVHLEEVELSTGIEEELAGAGIHVAGRLRRGDRRGAHARPQLGRHRDTRRLLDHLLVTALYRTLALAEMQHGAVLVAEHLDLDMPRTDDVLLDVHRIVAKGVHGLALRGRERWRQLASCMDDAHTLPASTRRRLQQHGIPEPLGNFGRLVRVAERGRGAGDHRRARLDGELASGCLAAHRRDGLGRRADPDETRVAHGARKPFALGEKAITRVDRLGARAQGGRDDRVALEVRLARGRRAEPDGLVRLADVRGSGVGIGVHGHRSHTELAAGADDAQRDFASICYQYLCKHDVQILRFAQDDRDVRAECFRASLADCGRAWYAASRGHR